MNYRFLSVLVLLVAATLPVNDAHAGEMRCGNTLIEQGMLKAQVTELCGEPVAIEDYGTVWIYDQGPQQFLKIVRFADNVVQFVDEKQRQ